jgi:hypothetical protein
MAVRGALLRVVVTKARAGCPGCLVACSSD